MNMNLRAFCLATIAIAAPVSAWATATLPLKLNDSVVTTDAGVHIVAAHTPLCGAPPTGDEWAVDSELIASNADLAAASGMESEQVFGLTLRTNPATGEADILVASSSLYGAGRGASGTIYRIDGVTGAASVFRTLPVPYGGGIAQLAYNADKDIVYAASIDTGEIFSIDGADGSLKGVLDPFAPYFTHPGDIAPVSVLRSERFMGLAYNPADNRVYGARWMTDRTRASKGSWNRIYSFCLDADGVAIRCPFPQPPWSLEVTLTNLPGGYSSPVTDIAFNADGTRMLTAERSMSGDWGVVPGASRVQEFVGSGVTTGGSWMVAPASVPPSSPTGASFSIGATGLYAAGGVDYDRAEADGCNAGPHVLATADLMWNSGGVQLMPADGADLNNSWAAVVDGGMGDLDVCGDCPPHPEVCGDGFDNDGDGLSDCDDPDCADQLDCTDGGENCTRTQGFWKNHTSFYRGNRHFPWPIPENTVLCEYTWLEILQTRPRGDTWLILAHQYVAASLNVAQGAQPTPEVEQALADAEALLTPCEVSVADRSFGLEAKDILDDFNNGFIGPGHCDDVLGDSLGADRSGDRGLRSHDGAGCNASTVAPSENSGALLWTLFAGLSLLAAGRRRSS